MTRILTAGAVAVIAVVLLVGSAFAVAPAGRDALAAGGVDVRALPPLARQMLPLVEETLAGPGCEGLPAVWVLAEVQAESGWDPHAFSRAGAAGLLQLMPGTWTAAGGPGGSWTTATPPQAGHPVWDPRRHLPVALGRMCANLRVVTQHLQATGKPTSALDTLAVCHIAGCSRVTGSRTGIPVAGEAACGVECVREITSYLATIDRYVAAYTLPAPVAAGSAARPASGFAGVSAGCSVPDPSGTGGCVTPALAWLMSAVRARFGPWPVACWSSRGGDPYSDHPRGRACDYTVGRIGRYAEGAEVDRGWLLAGWLRANATALHVDYVIWQGRIWSTAHDRDGWRPYTGGGVYDSTGPTHGHYDHVHVSTTD